MKLYKRRVELGRKFLHEHPWSASSWSRPSVREVLYGVYCGGARPGMRCVKKGDWKLIKFYHYDKVELYNLAKDPSEKNDLSRRNSAKAKELEDKLVAWQTKMKAKLPVPNPNHRPPAKKQK